MSLPLRRPPSRSQQSHSPSTSSTESDNTTPKQGLERSTTPTSTTMAQPLPASSPLSSVPSTPKEAVTPPSSSPPEQPSPTVSNSAAPPSAEVNTTTTSTGNTVDPIESPSSTSNMAKKRSRDDESPVDPPPAKKTNGTSKSKTKAKPVPKKASAEKTAPKQPAAKKVARPPPPPSTRPSRNRKAPERFEDLQEAQPVKETPVRKGPSKVFDPVFITTNSTSRLGKADVYHMLLEPAAWTSLSAEQQSTLLAMLPECASNTAMLAKIKAGETEDTRPHAFTINNDCFRTDVAKFTEDLKNGHLAKTWQTAAEQAVIERAAGDYDAWKAEEAELWWGQKGKAL
ncbi:Asx homology domain-containing protein [Paraphoma chrysanthemicola]|nr:Asx homology domain-containing protein [Paraphoma chrysanthemicola]